MKYQSLSIAFLMTFAVTINAQTLCDNTEKVVFSCKIGKKTLSVCASKDLDDEHGWMQYRFGTKEKMELVYPEQKLHPKKYFSSEKLYSSVYDSVIDQLIFKRANTTYTVYTQEIRGKFDAGVTVTINSKDIELRCKGQYQDDDFGTTISRLYLDQSDDISNKK